MITLKELIFMLGENFELILSFATALIGALVGGVFTLKGVDREARITRAEADKEALELQLSVLKGVKGELITLFNLYNKRMRTHVDNIVPGQALNLGFPIGDDNFTFYEQNAKFIAKLSDDARDSIINIYTYARSLIQSYKGNNQLIEEYEKILFGMAENNKDNEMYARLHDAKVESMIDYAQGIKAIDAELNEAIEKGFNVIDNEITALQCKLKNNKV